MKTRKRRLTALLTALVTAAALFPMTLTASAYQGEDGAEYEATLDHTALTAVIDGIEYGTTVPSVLWRSVERTFCRLVIAGLCES